MVVPVRAPPPRPVVPKPPPKPAPTKVEANGNSQFTPTYKQHNGIGIHRSEYYQAVAAQDGMGELFHLFNLMDINEQTICFSINSI